MCCCKKAKRRETVKEKVEEKMVQKVEKKVQQTPVINQATTHEVNQDIKEIEKIEPLPPLDETQYTLGIELINQTDSPHCGQWANTMYIIEGDKASKMYETAKLAHNAELQNTSADLHEQEITLADFPKSLLTIELQHKVKVLISAPFKLDHPVSTVRSIHVIGDFIEDVISAGHSVRNLVPENLRITHSTPQMNAEYEQSFLNDYALSSTFTSADVIACRKQKAYNARVKKPDSNEFVPLPNYETELAKDFPIGIFELDSSEGSHTWANIFYLSDVLKTKYLFLATNHAFSILMKGQEDLQFWCKSHNFQNSFLTSYSFEPLAVAGSGNKIKINEVQKSEGVTIVVSDVFLNSFPTNMRAVKILGSTKEAVINAQNKIVSIHYTPNECQFSENVSSLLAESAENKEICRRLKKLPVESKDNAQGRLAYLVYIPTPFAYKKYFGVNPYCKLISNAQKLSNTTISCSSREMIYKGELNYMMIIRGEEEEQILRCVSILFDSVDSLKRATVDCSNRYDRQEMRSFRTEIDDLSDDPVRVFLGDVSDNMETEDGKFIPGVKTVVANFGMPKTKENRGPFFDSRDARMLHILERYKCSAKFIGVIEQLPSCFVEQCAKHKVWYDVMFFGNDVTSMKKCVNSVQGMFPLWVLMKFRQWN